MAHDVFISHSSRDKPVSDAVCAALENAGIRCWVAPRDVQPGRSFAGEITRAIQQSKAMVLIFSANSNNSSQVLREVQLAVDSQLHILQFRIEEVLLNDDLKYYLSTPHWLDAMTPPLGDHLGRLSASIKTLLGKPEAVPLVASAPPPQETNRSVVAPTVKQERAPPASPGIPPAKPTQRNFWMPALVAAVVICGIVLGVILLRQRQQSQSASSSQTPLPRTAAAVERSEPYPTPSAKGARILTHNFDTATPIFKPLYAPTMITVLNAKGEGVITGKNSGFLPAMSDTFLVDQILECGIRAETVPPGGRYGFVFRATAPENGLIKNFYALLLDPNQKIVEMRSWMEGRAMLNPEQTLPAGLLKVGEKSRITLEAIGNRIRVFIDGKFGAEFNVTGLSEGRIGLCILGADSTPWTVHFENLQVYLPPAKETATPFQRSWDFSAGMLTGVRTEGVEVVDASVWKMAGGKHLRFLTGGRSFLEATFDIPDGTQAPTRLTVRHLSSSPDGKQPGYSPIRITLNGNEIFRGSPADKGWMENEIDLGNYTQPGRNTLLWEYLDGAQTHYWLKSFRLSSSVQ